MHSTSPLLRQTKPAHRQQSFSSRLPNKLNRNNLQQRIARIVRVNDTTEKVREGEELLLVCALFSRYICTIPFFHMMNPIDDLYI